MIFRTIALAGADERQRANADGSSGTQAGRLGNFPFWRGSEHFAETMDRIYRAAADAGLQVFLAEHGSGIARSS